MVKDLQYVPLEDEKCSDLVGGVLYINSRHYLNARVLGKDKKEFDEKLKADPLGQYRVATVMVEQAVFRLAEEWYVNGKMTLENAAPVTSMRGFIDKKTHQYAPKIVAPIAKI